MKTYHLYHGESKQAEIKLRHVENQKQKVEQHASKGTLSRKVRSFEKQQEKVSVSQAKCLLKIILKNRSTIKTMV